MNKAVEKASLFRYGLVFGISASFLFFLFLFSRSSSPAAAQFNQDQYGNAHGFAWSDTIGRVSFNCNNDFDGDGVVETGESQCAISSYGVNINSDQSLSGFAWSDSVGWVCFGVNCLPGTTPGEPLGEGTEAKAWIDSVGLIHGWARVLSLSASDGWLSLKGATLDGENFSSQVDFVTGNWVGFAWQREAGGPGLGWFNFFGVNTSYLPPCQNGQTMACGSGIGACVPGTRLCVNNQWGVCQGATGPVPEICGNDKDENCDGAVDNCAGCDAGTPISCQAGVCSGFQSCINGLWTSCQYSNSPMPEICDGADNNCNGLIDELASCQLFQVIMPQGIYEPLCHDADGKEIFCPGPYQGNPLVGSRLHQFEVKIQNAQANTAVTCRLDKAETEETFSGVTDTMGGYSFVYTPKTSDTINNLPWILTDCQVGGDAKTINQPIYVHSNNWTDTGENSDLSRALQCYQGVKNAYLGNQTRCDFEGDVVFVRAMARGVPIETDCSDKIDNDGDGATDCADRWCHGLSYKCLANCLPGQSSTPENLCKETL
ncbi:MAG: MopE-related protein [bacterium]|nr:MopE-related protein [bacterium]